MKNQLRRIRTEKGLALAGLAVRAGASTSTLSAIERYGYVPVPETQERIAGALGVTAREIWPEAEKEAVTAGQ